MVKVAIDRYVKTEMEQTETLRSRTGLGKQIVQIRKSLSAYQ